MDELVHVLTKLDNAGYSLRCKNIESGAMQNIGQNGMRPSQDKLLAIKELKKIGPVPFWTLFSTYQKILKLFQKNRHFEANFPKDKEWNWTEAQTRTFEAKYHRDTMSGTL